MGVLSIVETMACGSMNVVSVRVFVVQIDQLWSRVYIRGVDRDHESSANVRSGRITISVPGGLARNAWHVCSGIASGAFNSRLI